jgi:GTP pyrophosphokinase
MITETTSTASPHLPETLSQALPLLLELPAPTALMDLLADCQADVLVDSNSQRIRQKILHWEKQRHRLVDHLPDNPEQWETFRRMLLSMFASPFVLLSALAMHLHELRHFRDKTEEQQRQLAMLTQSVYAPIANRLSLSAWKWEMEDIAFRLANPTGYAQIAKALASKRAEREAYIHDMILRFQNLIASEHIPAEIVGRPKHLYSIHKKMQKKSLSFEQLYDLHALRILTQTVEDCYRILGILHQHFLPILGEFDEYIARPKANGYQSIHTILIGPKGWVVEVQIRTHQMHQLAEEGVAAHWRYKEGTEQDDALANLVNGLRDSLAGELDALSFDAWEKELEGRYVYVLSPKGDLLKLTQGATALDFAYHIHTELGHRCRGALVNGKIKPLDEPLTTGERVEVLTQKQAKPSLNWLSGQFLATSRARNKVKNYFNRANAEAHYAVGKDQLEKLKSRFRLGVEFVSYLQAYFHIDQEKMLAERIGQGKISSDQLSKAVQAFIHPKITPPNRVDANKGVEEKPLSDIFVPHIGRVTAHLAKCCQPQVGDDIIGLLTRQHGLRIHRQTCSELLSLSNDHHQRLLTVRWSEDHRLDDQLCLDITALERENLLADLVNCLTQQGIKIGHFHTHDNQQPHTVRISLTLSLPSHCNWMAMMDKLEALDHILEVRCCLE